MIIRVKSYLAFGEQRGRTLIEMLIVGLILSIVVGITGSLFAAGSRTFSRETVSVALHADIAAAKNVLLDDLSIAGYRPGDVDTGPFESVATNAVTFIGDVDSDDESERITYQLAGGALLRTVQKWTGATWQAATPELLAQNVQIFDLVYLDESRLELTAEEVEAGDASYVQVTIGVGANAKGGPIAKTISGEVALRN